MKRAVIILLTMLLLLSVAACGKGKTDADKKDANAVLTDSNVPLEVGAEVWDFSETQQNAVN